MQKIRQSNLELMRIISMIFIIIYHIIIHGNLLTHTDGVIYFCLNLLLSIIIIHVNSFVIVSGYFNYNKEFSFKKVISLLNQVFFYSLLIVIIFQSCHLIDFSNIQILKQLSYIPFSDYWFIKDYIILYCISPFLNILIRNINKKQYKNLLITLFIFFSIIPTLTGNNTFNSNNGYSLYQFVFLYFLGAYLHIYPIEKSILFKNLNKRKTQLTLVIIFFICAILNLSLYFLSEYIGTFNSNIFNEISNYLHNSFLSYCNPIVIIQTICYFLYFRTLDVKNRLVNIISKFTFGVYLIHDNSFIRQFLYKWINIDKGTMIYSKSLLIKIILYGFIIYILCVIIDLIRYYLFKFITRLKLSKKISNKFENFIESLK